MTTCRFGGPSHLSREAKALAWFNDSDQPIAVCGSCSKAILSWMAGGRVNAAGQYPVAHYPLNTPTGRVWAERLGAA